MDETKMATPVATAEEGPLDPEQPDRIRVMWRAPNHADRQWRPTPGPPNDNPPLTEPV